MCSNKSFELLIPITHGIEEEFSSFFIGKKRTQAMVKRQRTARNHIAAWNRIDIQRVKRK
jgi:hypothetical protein